MDLSLDVVFTSGSLKGTSYSRSLAKEKFASPNEYTSAVRRIGDISMGGMLVLMGSPSAVAERANTNTLKEIRIEARHQMHASSVNCVNKM
mmetsp:Transcript_1480/g.3245  ORF Transcript_1480/g.3245 Transcript_1480/m.3245 type:complete len:91 (-) Transcript_1480:144-416(-)